MKISYLQISAVFMVLLVSDCYRSIAQTSNYEDKNDNNVAVNVSGVKGFHVGFYAGALFPSNYPASLYDGYGVDVNGNKNSFYNSVLVQRMIYNGMDSINSPGLPGGGSIYNDVISQALGVNHDQWHFDSTDMPISMKYTPAFLFGLNLQYGLNKSEGLILNINFAQVTVTGTFTIEIPTIVNSTLGSGYDSVLYFGIKGQEQRFNFQFGYNRILGDPDDMFNVVAEGGLLFNSTKYVNDYAYIGNLKIDLTPFTYNGGIQNNYLPTYYNAVGYGAFAGIGGSICTTKYLIQLLYTPSFERIGIGVDPSSKLQNAIGLRVYYGL